MSKQIHLKVDGKAYDLEFTRESVKAMERQGFSLDDLSKKPVTAVETLFVGAFVANHPTMKRDKAIEIFYEIQQKNELISELAKMYSAPVSALFDEPEDGGNVSWTADV